MPAPSTLLEMFAENGGAVALAGVLRALQAAGAPITVDTVHGCLISGISAAADFGAEWARTGSISYTGGSRALGLL